ncbi:MAG: type II toxin-antitoxin system RelE/ParE family toxin [Betaproteobacteria bacterium]
MTRRLSIARDAQAQIEAAAAWWKANRPSAPGAIREELDRLFSLLLVQPGLGAAARNAKLKDVRRITISRIRYHVYYRATDDSLEILAFWHTSRGREPPL